MNHRVKCYDQNCPYGRHSFNSANNMYFKSDVEEHFLHILGVYDLFSVLSFVFSFILRFLSFTYLLQSSHTMVAPDVAPITSGINGFQQKHLNGWLYLGIWDCLTIYVGSVCYWKCVCVVITIKIALWLGKIGDHLVFDEENRNLAHYTVIIIEGDKAIESKWYIEWYRRPNSGIFYYIVSQFVKKIHYRWVPL